MIDELEQFIGWVNWVLPMAFAGTLLVWLVLTAALLAGRLLYDRHQRLFGKVQDLGAGADAQRILSGLPVAAVARAATDPAMPTGTAVVLARHAVSRLSVDRVVRASASSRSDRRRVRALRLLALAGHPALIALLDAALHSGRENVVDAAVSLLGKLEQEAAAKLLVGALRERLFQTSRVATELDHFRLGIAHLIRPLLDATEPGARYWGAALAARYVDADGFSEALLRLTRDVEPMVRKAAIQSLRNSAAAGLARDAAHLTRDAVFYVRAHAARTLAASRDPGVLPYIVPLLADPEWWVRLAARESLASMGPIVVRAVHPLLNSPNAAVAEGAAEILYNVGYVDAMFRKAAKCREEEALALLRSLLFAGGEMLLSTALARYSGAEMPALAWLEPALRRAARR